MRPVASVTRLFKRVNGKQGVAVTAYPPDLDIAASRTGDKLYLHVANMNYQSPWGSFTVPGMTVASGKVHEIAPEDPLACVFEGAPDLFKPTEKAIAAAPVLKWTFPARSVSAVELDLKA